MLYFANPTSSPTASAEMAAGRLGFSATPRQGNRRPAGAIWCADNGCFSDKFDEQKWWAWLQSHAGDASRCWFATAPDVVGDAEATRKRSAPWLPKIRELGYRVAFVAQDGICGAAVPWEDFDWLFLGGTDRFKLGAEAKVIAAQARDRGKPIHMGRVNSLRRWRYAEALGCASCDGTFLTFGPDANLPRLLAWVDDLHRRPALFALGDVS